METKIEKVLGEGNFGIVYLMNIKSSEQKQHKLALKSIKSRDETKNRMLKEMEIMKDLSHQHIVKYYTGHLHKDKILLLLEYCPGTDLFQYLETCKPSSFLTEPQVYKFGSQIASAIVYLHKKHIIHRDIKPNNILLTEDKHVKLADFGLSRQLENTQAQAETHCGTKIYMAPEILNDEKYSYKADSWSFGCVLHELMSLHYAFGGDSSVIRNKILSAKFPELPSRFNDNLHILVKMLLVVDVNKRLNIKDAFSSLQGMREDATDILPPAPEIPNLPDEKTVISAIRKYNVECNKDPDPEPEPKRHALKFPGITYSDNFINEYNIDYQSNSNSNSNSEDQSDSDRSKESYSEDKLDCFDLLNEYDDYQSNSNSNSNSEDQSNSNSNSISDQNTDDDDY